MKAIALALLGMILVNIPAFARTGVYFKNATDINFSFDVSVGQGSLSGSYWSRHVASVTANEKKLLYMVNRDTGITNGKTFKLYGVLKPEFSDGNERIQVDIMLKGLFINSDYWSSVDMIGTKSPDYWGAWHNDDDYSLYNYDFTFSNGKSYRLTSQNLDLVGDDDILFTLREVNRYDGTFSTDFSNPNVINVCAWNVYQVVMAPDLFDRTDYFAGWLKPYDVVVISEAFENGERSQLKNELYNAGYRHQTAVVDHPAAIEDGGVFVASRFPIVAQAVELYDQSSLTGSDAFSAKGIQYVKINKHGKLYNIFGTHSNAGGDSGDQDARMNGFRELTAFWSRQNIPTDEPVIIAGDLNVDKVSQSGWYSDMLNELNAFDPNRRSEYIYTCDAGDNSYISGSADEILDYVLFADTHKTPHVHWTRVVAPFDLHDSAPNVDDGFDLSDHWAVHGRFEFITPSIDTTKEYYLVPEVAPYLAMNCEGSDIKMSRIDSANTWKLSYLGTSTIEGFPTYSLKNAQADLWMDIAGHGQLGNLGTWSSSHPSVPDQRFAFKIFSDGTYVIASEGRTENVVVDSRGTAHGTSVEQYYYHANRYQRWRLVPADQITKHNK